MKVLLFDLSNTILFAKDTYYIGGLNRLHEELVAKNPDYDFLSYFRLDTELLEYLKSYKNQFRLVLFTSESIQNEPSIRPLLDEVFDEVLSALDIGLKKTTPEAYTRVAQELGVDAQEILFFDDSEKNIEAAKSAGLNAEVYKNFAELKTTLENIV